MNMVMSYDHFSLKFTDIPYNARPCTHPTYEIHYLKDGKIEAVSSARKAIVSSGFFMLFKSGEVHRISTFQDSRYARYELMFDAAVLTDEQRDQLLSLFDRDEFVYQDADGIILKDIQQLESVLFSDYENKKQQGEQRINVLLSDILLLGPQKAEHKYSHKYPVECRAVDFIREHIYEPMTVLRVANHHNVSTRFLERKFKSRWNIGVKEYINISRYVFARELISRGVPKADAAFNAGYREYTTFYRASRRMENDIVSLKEKINNIQTDFSSGFFAKLSYHNQEEMSEYARQEIADRNQQKQKKSED